MQILLSSSVFISFYFTSTAFLPIFNFFISFLFFPLPFFLSSPPLPQVDRRWAWFRRLLRTVDSKFSTVCPPHWRLPLRLCLEFTDRTKVLLLCVMLWCVKLCYNVIYVMDAVLSYVMFCRVISCNFMSCHHPSLSNLPSPLPSIYTFVLSTSLPPSHPLFPSPPYSILTSLFIYPMYYILYLTYHIRLYI